MDIDITDDFYDFTLFPDGIGKENYRRNVKML